MATCCVGKQVFGIGARSRLAWIIAVGLRSGFSSGTEERDHLLSRCWRRWSHMLTLVRQGSTLWDNNNRQGYGLDRCHGGDSSKRVPERRSSCMRKGIQQWYGPTMESTMGPAIAHASEPAVDEQRASLAVTCLQQDNCLHRGSVRAIQLVRLLSLFSYFVVLRLCKL